MDQPAGREAVGRSSRRSAGPRARARPSRRAQPIWQEISRVRVGRAAWAAVGEAAPRAGLRGETPPRQPGPDKGRGPSTHEMEGPIRSSSAGHRYLMLSVRTTRSTTKPDTRLKSQLPSSPCAPGCPPDGSVFGSERFLRLSRAGAQEVSASNFKIFWPSTNCPQLSPSYPPVDPLSPHEIHRRAAYPVPGGLFGGPTDTVAPAAAVPLALSPGAEPGQPDAVPGQPNAKPGNLAPRPRKPDAGQRLPPAGRHSRVPSWAPQGGNRRTARTYRGWVNGGRGSGRKSGSAARRLRPRRGPAVRRRWPAGGRRLGRAGRPGTPAPPDRRRG
jgi:hypothetical protein